MKLLFILDWTLFLPITLTRLGIIYFEGSRYNIEGLKFLDVMMHSENKYFNQNEDLEPSIDTTTEDVRKIIKYDSHLYEMTEIKKDLINKLLDDNVEIKENKENKENNINSKSQSNNILYDDISPKQLSETQSDSQLNSDSQSQSNSDSESDKLYDSEEEELEKLKNKYDLDFLIKSAKDKINVMMNK